MLNVVFDLGGVVFEWDPDKILSDYYPDPESRRAMKAAVFQHPDWLRMDRGTLAEAEMVARVRERTGRPEAEVGGLLEAVRVSLTPKPETLEWLRALAESDVPLYCLSNMPASTFAYLSERHGFLGLFRGTVISGEVKLIKPEREIFELLLERFGLAGERTVFIDDHLPNIKAAQALGIHTIWFQGAHRAQVELEGLLRA